MNDAKKIETTWTHFWDMNSGGGRKEKWAHIFIEAPEEEAKVIFYNRFNHNPERVSCSCCGGDYSISEGTLAQITGYHRGCAYDMETHLYVEMPRKDRLSDQPFMALEEYMKNTDAMFIPATDIKENERNGSLPKSGWVWVD